MFIMHLHGGLLSTGHYTAVGGIDDCGIRGIAASTGIQHSSLINGQDYDERNE